LAGSFAGMSPALVHRASHWRAAAQEKDGMAEDEPWQDPKSPQDARLASLDERLARAQAEEAERTAGSRWTAPLTSKTEGGRILSVLFGYPLGSALIGWVIDRWAGTSWVVLAMLFLGFGAAIREVWKISTQKPDQAEGSD
jgi:ATP synthase protein I